MKHPLFALAGVVAMAALASDPSPRSGDIALDGFENYTTGQSVTTESDSWTGSTDAVVTEYGNGEAPTGIAFPTPFTDAGDQYLAIDTGSDEVTCSAESSAATVYIDTLAQFSVLKAGEAAPEASDAKLLLWLQEDIDNGVATTNLYVRGGYYDDTTPQSDRDYKLNKACEPGRWYRVTIEAYNNILTEYAAARLAWEGDDPIAVSGFVIKIDGQEVAAEESVYAPGQLEQLCPDQTGTDPGKDDGLSQGMYDLFSSNKLIPAIGEATATTVSAVAFKGSGAIDDFVVSANDPASFILTWPTELTSVSYVLGSDATVYPPLSSGSITISAPEGTQVSLTGSIGEYSKTVTGTVTAGGSLSLPDLGIVYFFPRTSTAGQDGTAANPFEIADVDDLNALAAVANAGFLTGGNLNFVQIADIDFTGAAAFAGIGVAGAENATTLTEPAFEGVYDGNNMTISNITFTNRKGSGLFNLVRNATIKDLTVDTVSYEAPFNAQKLGGAMIVGNGVNCTLQHLVTLGSNGLNNPCTYNAAGIANRLEGRGGPVLVIGCTNSAAIYGVYSKVGGICPIVQGDSTTVTFVDCANTGAIVANGTSEQITLSGKTPGVDGAAGILAYSQGGSSGDISLTNCVNTGTITGVSGTTIGTILGKMGSTGIVVSGGSAQATIASVGAGADKVSGIKFATVDNGVASFVADDALALNGSYKVMSGNATATFVFTAPGTISFDESLATPTYAITSSGAAGNPTSAKVGDVTTYTTGYFPRTATAGQDGSAEHPFEIADLDDLEALQAAVANDAETYQGLFYVQVADIVMTNAWPGIGPNAGKDLVNGTNKNIPLYESEAFSGTYNGGNYTISNFQMANGCDYGALFNSVNNATIKNLKISWGASTLTPGSSGDTGATFVGVARGSTLQNLTTLAGTVTTVTAAKDIGGIVGYLMAGSTVDSCTNEINVASSGSSRKCGGIAIITQEGTGTATIRNCKNSGTVTATNKGGLVGYIGVATEIDGCENTAAVQLFHFQSGSVSVSGVNKGNATVASNDKSGGVSGLYFATVDGDVATFVADNALALNGSYKVMATGATATFNFTAPGTISFDTNLVQAVTFAITAAEELTLTDATANGVITYTATGAGGDDDYVVTINGSDVVITPSAEDLAAVQAAVIAGGGTLDVTDVAAVNAALADEIGSTGIPSWQALFLGLPPTEAGLESFKIASISFNEDGEIVMTLPSSVDPKTGRGVNIALNLMGSDDLSSWTFIEAATGTTFAPVTPALGETKKFYKVVAVFSATDAE